MANAKLTTKGSKTRSIKRFGENVNKLFLGLNSPHHNLSILNIVSQEKVSHLNVFDLNMDAGIFGQAYGTGVVTEQKNTLKD